MISSIYYFIFSIYYIHFFVITTLFASMMVSSVMISTNLQHVTKWRQCICLKYRSVRVSDMYPNRYSNYISILANNLQVSKICKSFSGLFPSVPPNTNSLFPTVVQLWLSRREGGMPFTIGLLQVCLTENSKEIRQCRISCLILIW